jgi:DNA-binding NarL/FixJ family response regulator
MRPTVSIVLLDDHRIVREGLAAFFDERPGLHIVGQCSDGFVAVEMIKALAPDFAILDLNHPGLHGLDVIREVREANCPSKLVVLSISRDEEMVLEALRAGANGYLVKDGPMRHLFDAINHIQSGGVYISPLIRGQGYAGVSPNLPRRPSRPRRPPKTQNAAAASEISWPLADAIGRLKDSTDPDAGGGPLDDGAAGVRAPLPPRLPLRPPIAVKLPLPE